MVERYRKILPNGEEGRQKLLTAVTTLAASTNIFVYNKIYEVIKSLINLDCCFMKLNRSYWNFLDFELLKGLIDKVDDDNLKKNMEIYENDMSDFKKATKVVAFAECWPGYKMFDDDSVTLESNFLKIDMTLQDLFDYRNRIRKDYIPFLASCVACFYYEYFFCNCIKVIWRIPKEISEILYVRVINEPDHSLFIHFNVTSVIIGGKLAYENQHQQTENGKGKYKFYLGNCVLITGICFYVCRGTSR